jgi:hypothetical protein
LVVQSVLPFCNRNPDAKCRAADDCAKYQENEQRASAEKISIPESGPNLVRNAVVEQPCLVPLLDSAPRRRSKQASQAAVCSKHEEKHPINTLADLCASSF